jgi:hypothetical protein
MTSLTETALDTAVLSAVRSLSPHASWDAIAHASGHPRYRIKGALDRLEAAGLIQPSHWHEGKSKECVTDAE